MRRTAFTSYMCLNSALLANFALNGSCGVPRNISFAPCRCASERERETEGVSEREGGREEREREKRERESSAACFQLLCKETCNVSVSMACKDGKTTRAQRVYMGASGLLKGSVCF